MIARIIAAACVVAAAVSCAAPPPAPVTNSGTPGSGPPLEAGRLVFDSDRTGNYEVFSLTAEGADARQLTKDARYDSWWPRLSPDRARILFYRTPKGVHDTDFTKTALWMMKADGTEARELRPAGASGWDQQGHAEWSPDGASLVMFGGARSNPQIFVTDADGTHPRQVTARGGTNIDPSWSPDGSTIVFIGCPNAICFENDYEVYTTPLAGGDARRLTTNGLRDHDPYYSPDGSRIAWLERTDAAGPLGAWNIRSMAAGGGDERAVTSDGNVNSKPEWSRDGSRILFHRFVVGGTQWQLFSVPSGGGPLKELTPGAPGNNEFPSD